MAGFVCRIGEVDGVEWRRDSTVAGKMEV